MGILDYQDSATRAKKILQLFGPASSAWGELRSSLSFPLHTPQPQPTPSLPPMHTGSLVSLVTPSSPATQARQSMSYLHVGAWGKTHRLWCTLLIKPNPTRLPTLPDPTQPNCHHRNVLWNAIIVSGAGAEVPAGHQAVPTAPHGVWHRY